MPAQKIKAAFTEPMLLMPARELPEGANWTYELKLDGYRALAVKTNGQVHLRSGNNKDFNARYPTVVKALAPLVGHVEFVEWRPDGHLRHSSFIALRADRDARRTRSELH